ncbi:MAG: TonB-dependent receptor plug domain-containing protein [Gemmatimonadota bacterium]
MPRPRLFVFLVVAMLVPSALPARARAQDAAADSLAEEDSLGGAPEGAFPVPIVDPRLTLLGDTLSPGDTTRPKFSELPEFYPDTVVDPYVAPRPGARPAWMLTGEELVGRGAFSLLDILESEFPVWSLDLGGGGVNTYLGPALGTVSGVEVFVDGVAVGDPLTAAWDLRQIPLEAIARVAWYPGPQSAVWGGKGTAGVLAITTRRSLASSARSLLAFSAGSFDTETFSGRFGRPVTWHGDVFVAANFDGTNGFLGSGDFTRNQTLLKAGWRPWLGHRFEASRIGDDFSGEDNRLGLAGVQEQDLSVWHLSYVGALGPVEARAHYARTRMDLDENFDFRDALGLIGTGERSDARLDLTVSRGPLSIWWSGARGEEEASSGHIVFVNGQGTNLLDPPEGVQGLVNPRTTLELGGGAGLAMADGRLAGHVAVRRLDHDNWAEGGTAWQVAASGRPVEGLEVSLAAGRAVRPPDFPEMSILWTLAEAEVDVHPGRPAEPTALEAWREVRGEVAYGGEGWRAAARAWSADADGALVWLPPTAWIGFDPVAEGVRVGEEGFNTFDALDLSASGVEGEVAFPLPWGLRGRAVARRTTVEAADTGERLPYLPETQALGQLRYARRFFPSRDLLIEARLTGRYSGERTTLDGEALPSYLATDVLLQGTIINFTIFVSFKNVGGLSYRAEEAFFLPGREGYFGVNWRFRN